MLGSLELIKLVKCVGKKIVDMENNYIKIIIFIFYRNGNL